LNRSGHFNHLDLRTGIQSLFESHFRVNGFIYNTIYARKCMMICFVFPVCCELTRKVKVSWEILHLRAVIRLGLRNPRKPRGGRESVIPHLRNQALGRASWYWCV